MPRDKKQQSIYDLQSILTDAKSPLAPYSQIGIDPETGVPMVGIPEPTDIEMQLAQGLSPTKQPSATQPKAMMPNEKDLGLPPNFLATTPDQQDRREQISQDQFAINMGLDREKVKQMIGRSQSGLDEIRQTIQDFKQSRPDIDLRPLAGFIDPWIGSNIASNLPKPQSKEERAAMIAKLQGMVSEQEDKQTNAALELLKANISKRQTEQSGRQSRFSEAMTFKVENDIQNRFQKEITNPLTEAYSSINAMDTNLSTGNIQGLYDAASTYARTVQQQKGVLSDEDIARALPTSLTLSLAKMEAWMSGDRSEPLDPQVIQNLKQGIGSYRRAIHDVYSNKLNQTAGAYKKRGSTSSFMAPDQVGGFLYEENKALLEKVKPGNESTTQPPIPGGAMSFEEWKKSRAQANE